MVMVGDSMVSGKFHRMEIGQRMVVEEMGEKEVVVERLRFARMISIVCFRYRIGTCCRLISRSQLRPRPSPP